MPTAVDRLLPDQARRALNATLAFARRRDVGRVVLVLALLLAAAVYVRQISYMFQGDAYGYWLAIRRDHLYITDLGNAPHGYLYSPAFIQAIWPLVLLPWEAFYAIWLAVYMVVLVWLCRPWLTLAILPWVFVTFGIGLLQVPRHSISSGNVYLYMGLAVAAGFRWPSAHAFLLLTKVTPGITLLWFVVRREWRNLAIALVTTAAIVAVSFVVAPNLWFDWVTVLRNNSTYGEPDFALRILPLIPRLIIAAVVVAVAAWFNARWALPIAIILAMPYIADTAFIILVCVAPLLRNDSWTLPRPRRATGQAQAPAASPA
jgi:hypothetical protein